ncbi:hypothetical protein [Desulfolucanica intricata]|uniref:hypothetical protein n=1 Tax=Desulfolucanica intricata TaxID=1285191 RepID=UPI000830311B|nr:hypothetical protein [Desulfolucanica intricata]
MAVNAFESVRSLLGSKIDIARIKASQNKVYTDGRVAQIKLPIGQAHVNIVSMVHPYNSRTASVIKIEPVASEREIQSVGFVKQISDFIEQYKIRKGRKSKKAIS